MGIMKNENDPAPIDKRLLEELGALSKALADEIGLKGDGSKPALLARFVESTDSEQWITLSEQYNLRSWFIIPLCSTEAEAVAHLSSTMDNLVFQRDHDPLTGLANRRYLERYLTLELERAARMQSSLSLVMLDLDHFKKVNDTYGHLCGDKVLQDLAAFLRRSHRSYDLAARYGGEEFILILPGMASWRAKAMAERLLQQFSTMDFNCDGHKPFRMTFSAGVAGVSSESGYGPTPAQLIKQADEALYAAKNAGRSRVMIAKEVTEYNIATMVNSAEKQFLFKDME